MAVQAGGWGWGSGWIYAYFGGIPDRIHQQDEWEVRKGSIKDGTSSFDLSSWMDGSVICQDAEHFWG
jgi:hypothetical protein